MGAETVHKEQTCRKVASSKKQHESQKEVNHAARRKFPRNAWGEKKGAAFERRRESKEGCEKMGLKVGIKKQNLAHLPL